MATFDSTALFMGIYRELCHTLVRMLAGMLPAISAVFGALLAARVGFSFMNRFFGMEGGGESGEGVPPQAVPVDADPSDYAEDYFGSRAVYGRLVDGEYVSNPNPLDDDPYHDYYDNNWWDFFLNEKNKDKDYYVFRNGDIMSRDRFEMLYYAEDVAPEPEYII